MIHRFVDLLLQHNDPIIPFLVQEGNPNADYGIWKAGNIPAIPVRLFSMTNANSVNDYLADLDPWPVRADGGPMVYSRVGHNLTPKESNVMKLEWDASANVELYREASGEALSLQPSWRRDGGSIVFRSKATSGSLLAKIQTMDPDGTNQQVVYEAAAGRRVEYPRFNHDGTKLVWMEFRSTDLLFPRELWVANADGSAPAAIVSLAGTVVFRAGFHALARTQDAVAYFEADSTAFTATIRWKKINLDGTGAVTMFTQSRATGYGIADSDNGIGPYGWTPDDSGILVAKRTPGTDPDVFLGMMDPVAGGFTPTGAATLYTASSSSTPAFFQTSLGWRAYYLYTPLGPGVARDQLWATDTTGANEILEFDGDDPTSLSYIAFTGFYGDTLN